VKINKKSKSKQKNPNRTAGAIERFIEVDPGFANTKKINADGSITIYPLYKETKESIIMVSKIQRETIIRAIAKNMSFQSACYLAGITPHTLKIWMKENPVFKEKIEMARAAKLNGYLDKLDAHINSGSLTALMFILKTNYGFNEHMVVTAIDKEREIKSYDVSELKDVRTPMEIMLAKRDAIDAEPEELKVLGEQSIKNKKYKKMLYNKKKNEKNIIKDIIDG